MPLSHAWSAPGIEIESITIEQLKGIYGEGGATENWGDISITVPNAQENKIVRVSRQNNSGTYAYFKKAVLGKGNEYKLGSLDMHGSKDVVDLVADLVDVDFDVEFGS